MDEVAEFWDDFAAEYYQIQKESQVPIVTDIENFLTEQRLLPTNSVVDLGGGSGRYLPLLAQNSQQYTIVDISEQMLLYAQVENQALAAPRPVTYRQQSVADFSQQTPDQSYDLVWMALNPAITADETLLTITQKSRQWCGFLRLTQNTDDLFASLEQHFGIAEENPNIEPTIIPAVVKLLTSAGYQVRQQKFQYQTTETFDRVFLEAYYAEVPQALLSTYLDQVFANQKTRTSTTTLEYTLLYWHV
ncbi:class I SAM-dependent methyltransferase [Latilactobacillus sakei]|uniref:class I SAM-dependent methyltransferase n=1 Tax=Latilactobacillus sakei TaxID=1599 RepID=UPI00241D15B2|nr:class I SAM-dependent methyltransferase [Latilactobacillus sakei]